MRGIGLYTFQHKDYKVITKRDILIHVHYITARYKSKITICIAKGVLTAEKEIRKPAGKPGTEGAKANQLALRRKLDLQWRAPLQSTLQNLNIQIQGSQDLPNKLIRLQPSGIRDMSRRVDVVS